jgi:SHS2 domain-containing protein
MQKSNNNIKFNESIAIADIAFTVKGKDEEELFKNAAIALISSMADISKIDQKEEREIKLENEKFDLLLFDFLSEILLLKDSENLLFSEFKVSIMHKAKACPPSRGGSRRGIRLKAKIRGEIADPKKHKITIDIKAITMHMFEVNKTKDGYEARVVVDI